MSDDEQVEGNGRLHVQRVSSMAKKPTLKGDRYLLQ